MSAAIAGKPLSAEEVSRSMEVVPEWALVNGEITRQFAFENFRDSMSFVNLVAGLAEGANHHPDIDIRYNKVKLALVSHDAGGLTEADFSLARATDGLI